jgi:hypothetical protein
VQDAEFESVDSGLEEFRTATTEIVSACQELRTALETNAEELKTKFTDLTDTGGEMSTILVTSGLAAQTNEENLATTAGEAGSAVGQELKSDGLTAIDQFQTELTASIKESLMSGMDELETTLDGAYSTLQQNVENYATELRDKLGEAAELLVEHLGTEAREKIEKAIRDAVENAIEDFLSDVAEDVAMMGVGVQVTGVLSPILPELKVAERVLPVFNSALAALKIF